MLCCSLSMEHSIQIGRREDCIRAYALCILESYICIEPSITVCFSRLCFLCSCPCPVCSLPSFIFHSANLAFLTCPSLSSCSVSAPSFHFPPSPRRSKRPYPVDNNGFDVLGSRYYDSLEHGGAFTGALSAVRS